MQIRSLVSYGATFLSTIAWAGIARAQDYGLGETASKLGYNRSQTVYSLVGTITSAVLATTAIIFFVLAMYAGLRILTARGNQEYVDKAKSTLTAAVIGLAVTLAAYGLTLFIFRQLQTVPVQNQATVDAGNTNTTSPDSCFNTVKDGLETDFNCGGSCNAKCGNGRVCVQNKDCQSNNCVNGACMPAGTSCSNGVKDAQESDVDCGGSVCSPCGAGLRCGSGSDCTSGQSCMMNAAKGYQTCGGF